RSKLISFKRRYRFVLGIEEVFGVESRVSQKFEDGSVDAVLAGSRHGVDLASGGPAELCGIGIGQNLEFQHRFNPQQHTGGGARRLVVDIVDVGAVQQEVVLLRPGAVD